MPDSPNTEGAAQKAALDPLDLVFQSSGVVLGVLLILVVASVAVWFIWFLKVTQLARMRGVVLFAAGRRDEGFRV